MAEITLEKLTCNFGTHTVLRSLNTSFKEGTMCAIVGANAGGKTTLLRCIANLMQPQAGRVTIDGRAVGQYSANEMARKLSFVQQHIHTDFEFTAYEIVMMGRNPYQRRLQGDSLADKEIVEQCMQATNTLHLRDKTPRSMSGGELQRVVLARALAQQTPIMLLDEPTSNLDIAHQYELMELLHSLEASSRKTILIVVHDLNLALRYCDHCLMLADGQILMHGPTSAVLTPDNIKRAFNVNAKLTTIDGRQHILFSIDGR